MPIAISTLFLANLATAASVAAPAATRHSSGIVAVFDPGSDACGESFQAQNAGQASGWIYGYFSGRNVVEKSTVGLSLREAGVLAAVKAACERAPKQTLFEATNQEYEKLRASGG